MPHRAAVFYMITHAESIGRGTTALCVGIVVLGFVGMVIGLHNTLAHRNGTHVRVRARCIYNYVEQSLRG